MAETPPALSQNSVPFPLVGPYGYGGQLSLPYDQGTQSRTSFRYVDMSDAGFRVDPTLTQTTDRSEDTSAAHGFLENARGAFVTGNYAEALRWISHAQLENPQDGPLHLWASQCWLAQGDYEMAARELALALDALPPSEWRLNLRQLKLTYGQNADVYSDQMRRLADFSQEHPQSLSPHELLAFHGMDSDNLGAAQNHAAQAMKLDSHSTLARHLSENMRALNREEESTDSPTISPPPAPAELELLPQP